MKSISHISEYMNILLSTLTTVGPCNTYAWDRSLPLSMNETRARYIFFKAMWDEYVAMYVRIHTYNKQWKHTLPSYTSFVNALNSLKRYRSSNVCVHVCLYTTIGKSEDNIQPTRYAFPVTNGIRSDCETHMFGFMV